MRWYGTPPPAFGVACRSARQPAPRAERPATGMAPGAREPAQPDAVANVLGHGGLRAGHESSVTRRGRGALRCGARSRARGRVGAERSRAPVASACSSPAPAEPLAAPEPGTSCQVGICEHDMLCPDQRVPGLESYLPQLAAIRRAGSLRRGRSRLRQRRILGVVRLLVALVALVSGVLRVSIILDSRSPPSSIANRTCRTSDRLAFWTHSQLTHSVIEVVYSLRISPVLCGHDTHGLQCRRFSIFGSPR